MGILNVIEKFTFTFSFAFAFAATRTRLVAILSFGCHLINYYF
jgi:hypothetical protein